MKTAAARLSSVEAVYGSSLMELAQRYAAVKAGAARASVYVAVRLGRILELSLRELEIKHLSYVNWLEFLGESPSTAARFRHVARLAGEDPRQFANWASLGVVKLYWVSRLPSPDRRRVLTPFQRHRLTQMPIEDFKKLVLKHLPDVTSRGDRHGAAVLRRARAVVKAVLRLPRLPLASNRRSARSVLLSLERAARTARKRQR